MTEIETATDEWPGLQTIADREQLLLAPYAMHSVDSRGRRHAEPPHAYRGPFQRDRDRILHSSAFRRLSGKMQVFTGERGDYHRTRLTHTQEVASIARTIGRALRLNEDLIEALALFHDIGHPPFGHAGEDALDECLRDHGGFSHNAYGLTIARELETRHDGTPGLNLTREVLACQKTRIDKTTGPAPLLEAQVVDLADSITYDAHDTDDAVKLGMVTLDELSELTLVRDTMAQNRRRLGDEAEPYVQRKALVHGLIDRQVSSLLQSAADSLRQQRFRCAQDVIDLGFRLEHDSELAGQKEELEAFLYQRVYRHPELIEMRARAQSRLAALFGAFVSARNGLPAKYRRRIDEVGLHRAVGDYLAGMTDRFCNEQFEQVVGRPS
ncbi:MAG: dNTP triphosphohydrolase [Planctomycetales bacterium]|nr:dNTP triphosphohydrolase [Planctomycetales bacterium]